MTPSADCLMAHGILMYQDQDETWVIRKMATPTDSRLYFDVAEKTTQLSLDTKEEAMEFLASYLSEESKNQREYVMEIRYNEGLGYAFKNLGTVTTNSVEEAQRIAKEKAAKMFAKTKTRWDARVRPADSIN